MAEFKNILLETLSNEGGFSNDPDDSGGMTLFGIARNKNPKWGGWPEVDKIIKVNNLNANNHDHWDDIARLCKKIKSVEDFYRTAFWNKMKGEEIFVNVVAQSIFDYGVNAGMGTSIKCLQKTLKLVDDGDFGPKTLAALNEYTMVNPLFRFHLEFTLRKIYRYNRIVDHTPSNEKYIFGWTSRAFENIESMYDLDLITEPSLLKLYNFIKAGRLDAKIRQDTQKCIRLNNDCLANYDIK